ncbi:MAG: N-6 DNA methylase [Burkholderiaceae bacterium]|nr:N-6 DNA methylase [Burkholderiaceae bacterium]
MLTNTLRVQVNRLWDAFWCGGISDPLDILEQITYLLFLRHLDDMHTDEESRPARSRTTMARCIFPEAKNAKGRDYAALRWSRFKHMAPEEMYAVVREQVFPFLHTMGRAASTGTGRHMKGIRFTIPTPAVLAQVVDVLDQVPRGEIDARGDLYGYMLGKIVGARRSGALSIPRHIVRLMLELTVPNAGDVICDPASGICGVLAAAVEYMREKHPEILRDRQSRKHFHKRMFHGYDSDPALLRIGSMNMVLHGVPHADIRHKDWLAQDNGSDEGKYSLLLAAPFASSRDQKVIKSKKVESLFLEQCLRLLKPGGRAAIIVSDSVLSGSSTNQRNLRRKVAEEQRLDAVIALPRAVFRPRSEVAMCMLLFTKANSGRAGQVWFYDVRADGWSLDDRRQPLLDEEKLGASPLQPLTRAEQAKNNLPDLLARWRRRGSDELQRPRTAQSFCVPQADIIANGYHLSISRYRQIGAGEASQTHGEDAIPVTRSEERRKPSPFSVPSHNDSASQVTL